MRALREQPRLAAAKLSISLAALIVALAVGSALAGDDSDTPAAWHVTFGVDDAAATVNTARDLGGDVVVGPVEAPWSRFAVIKDPQGATFIASQFVPENRDLQA